MSIREPIFERTDGVLTPQALARTYDTPRGSDPWDAVREYARVQRAAAENPSAGSQALSSRLDLPRGRIRPWVESDTMPDPANAVAVGAERDWFTDRFGIAAAWARLVTGVVGGGSIANEWYEPAWTAEPTEAANRICYALEDLGVEWTLIERDDAPDEYRPAEHRSVLGRALVALGAPVSDKNRSTPPLPEWLWSASPGIRRQTAEVLVQYRGTGYDDKDGVQLMTERSREYRESVAALLESVLEAGSVTSGERWVSISAAAARELGVDREGALRSALE